jgi:hypothetical protein
MPAGEPGAMNVIGDERGHVLLRHNESVVIGPPLARVEISWPQRPSQVVSTILGGTNAD